MNWLNPGGHNAEPSSEAQIGIVPLAIVGGLALAAWGAIDYFGAKKRSEELLRGAQESPEVIALRVAAHAKRQADDAKWQEQALRARRDKLLNRAAYDAERASNAARADAQRARQEAWLAKHGGDE